MESNSKKYIIWAIRILSAALFILSAVGKLSQESVFDKPAMAISTFEKEFVVKGFGIDMVVAQYLSRLLIAVEFSIAILLLLPFYVKKVVIPGTILLLGGFSIHLAIQAIGGDTSNCGCFGSLIEMTPLESLVKNLVSIALLVLLITKFKKDWEDKSNIFPVLGVGVVLVAAMFIAVPMKDIKGGSAGSKQIDEQHYESGYANYFEDVDDGAKLLCFFSPTCEHCQETGKKIKELIEEHPDLNLEVRVIFMDEAGDGSAADIKTYFDFVGTEFEYKVETIEKYVPLFWGEYDFPGVMYLYNGQQKAFFYGTEDNEFDGDELIQVIQSSGSSYESGYANYFEDIDEGEKLLCFFSPTCEHCQETGKKIAEMLNEHPDLMPEMRIIFMDEAGDGSAADIKNYFDFVGAEYDYKVESIENFVPLFWGEYDFPGVMYLNNGQQELFFYGTEGNEFDGDKLLNVLEQN